MDHNILSLLTFFIGLFLGHRLTLFRDMRKEFNDIAQPIRDTLLNERENPTPNFTGLRKIDADRLESVLPFWKRQFFRKSWLAYDKSKQENIKQDITGQCLYESAESIKSSIDTLLAYTKRR